MRCIHTARGKLIKCWRRQKSLSISARSSADRWVRLFRALEMAYCLSLGLVAAMAVRINSRSSTDLKSHGIGFGRRYCTSSQVSVSGEATALETSSALDFKGNFPRMNRSSSSDDGSSRISLLSVGVMLAGSSIARLMRVRRSEVSSKGSISMIPLRRHCAVLGWEVRGGRSGRQQHVRNAVYL